MKTVGPLHVRTGIRLLTEDELESLREEMARSSRWMREQLLQRKLSDRDRMPLGGTAPGGEAP